MHNTETFKLSCLYKSQIMLSEQMLYAFFIPELFMNGGLVSEVSASCHDHPHHLLYFTVTHPCHTLDVLHLVLEVVASFLH